MAKLERHSYRTRWRAATSIAISGDTAAVTYDIRFAGRVAYEDQEGIVERVDGEWVVSRDEFCSFMAAARNPCAG